MRAFRTADRMGLGIAAGAVLIGLFILFDSLGIRLGSGYDRIGPRFFPWIVAAGLLVTGGLMLFELLRKAEPTAREPLVRSSLITLLMALFVCILLLETAGFIIAASVQFWLIARAFHSDRPRRDAVVAVLLSTGVYFVFTQGLGLVLPRGLLAGLI